MFPHFQVPSRRVLVECAIPPRDWDAEDLAHIDRRELELVPFGPLDYSIVSKRSDKYSLNGMLILIRLFWIMSIAR